MRDEEKLTLHEFKTNKAGIIIEDKEDADILFDFINDELTSCCVGYCQICLYIDDGYQFATYGDLKNLTNDGFILYTTDEILIEKPKPYNDIVVCLNNGGSGNFWTIGKAYEIKDGTIVCDEGFIFKNNIDFDEFVSRRSPEQKWISLTNAKDVTIKGD